METPNRKVMAGALAGALSVILIWLLQTSTAIIVPGEVASSITLILTFIVAYFVTEPT